MTPHLTAADARALALQKEKNVLPEIYAAIEKIARDGHYEIWFNIFLAQSAIKELESSGYKVECVNDMRDGNSTKISWGAK